MANFDTKFIDMNDHESDVDIKDYLELEDGVYTIQNTTRQFVGRFAYRNYPYTGFLNKGDGWHTLEWHRAAEVDIDDERTCVFIKEDQDNVVFSVSSAEE